MTDTARPEQVELTFFRLFFFLSSSFFLAGFIAPEVWARSDKHQGSYTYSADVYSFGILIFEMLSFRRPFEHLRGLAIQEQLLNPKNTYKDLVKDFTKAQLVEYDPLLRLFSQCCSIEPGERPTVNFICMSLKNILGSASSAKSPPVSRK